MTVSKTPRLGLTRWTEDSDPLTRQQMDESNASLESLAVGYTFAMPQQDRRVGFMIVNEEDGTAFFRYGTEAMKYMDLQARAVGASWLIGKQAFTQNNVWYRAGHGLQDSDPDLNPGPTVPFWFQRKPNSNDRFSTWPGRVYRLDVSLLIGGGGHVGTADIGLAITDRSDGGPSEWPTAPRAVYARGECKASDDTAVRISASVILNGGRYDDDANNGQGEYQRGYSVSPFIRTSNTDILSTFSYTLTRL